MTSIDAVRSFEVIKILADPRRLEILRRLMAAPATLTQLGRSLKHSPAWIRHHLTALQTAGLVQLHEVRVSGRATEKYYRAVSSALLLEQLVLPKSRLPIVVFSGSHDPALQAAVEKLGRKQLYFTLYVGSLNGLTNLRQGICHVSGIHLLDESGEYNRPYARHFFADREAELVTLAHRMQGLMLAPGNPRSIRRLQDLSRPGIRFVHRNRGSGTRLWLEQALQREGIDPPRMPGYASQVSTHTEAASLIHSGRADAALGLQASAHDFGLEFIPLYEERYDLVLPTRSEKILAPFLDFIQTADFRSGVHAMTGYNTAHSGEVILL